jgi:hypothetical protein
MNTTFKLFNIFLPKMLGLEKKKLPALKQSHKKLYTTVHAVIDTVNENVKSAFGIMY